MRPCEPTLLPEVIMFKKLVRGAVNAVLLSLLVGSSPAFGAHGAGGGGGDAGIEMMSDTDFARLHAQLFDAIKSAHGEEVTAILAPLPNWLKEKVITHAHAAKPFLSTLQLAARSGKTDVVRALLAAFTNQIHKEAAITRANWSTATAFLYAARAGYTDIVTLFLAALTDQTHKEKAITYADNGGYTALMHAAQHGHTAIIRMLLDAFAGQARKEKAINQGNRLGHTALIDAAYHGHTDIVRMLLDAFTDQVRKEEALERTNRAGETALVCAAGHAKELSQPATFIELVRHGALECATPDQLEKLRALALSSIPELPPLITQMLRDAAFDRRSPAVRAWAAARRRRPAPRPAPIVPPIAQAAAAGAGAADL